MGSGFGISLCMIVKDEEKILEKCLNHIHRYVDEIIIVDTGSKDKTIEIAKKYTEKIYNFKWNDNFSEARNFSLQFATKEWILVQDADEFIQGASEIRDFLPETTLDCIAIAKINIHINYDILDSFSEVGVFLTNKEYLQDCYYTSQEKILRNYCGFKYSGAVHEIVVDEHMKRPNIISFSNKLLHLMDIDKKGYKSDFYNTLGIRALYEGDKNINLLVRHLLYSLEKDNILEFYKLFDDFSDKLKYENRMDFLLPDFDKFICKLHETYRKRFLEWIEIGDS